MKDRTAVGSPQGSILSPCFWLHQASTSYYKFDQTKESLLEKELINDITLKGFADDNCHILEIKKSELETQANEESTIKKLLEATLAKFEKGIEQTGGILNQKKTEFIYHIEK